jgi:UDP-glucose 4-epimerase
VQNLAVAIATIFGVEPNPVTIGTRHGEKLYETLLRRDEMTHAEDRGTFFRVPLDARTLDYGLFFDEGDRDHAVADDYTSHNTERLNVEQVKDVVGRLDLVREAMSA